MSGAWRRRYGPQFPDHAAPEAIRANLDQAYEAQREAQQEIQWLSELLVRRCREVQRGEWPPAQVTP